MYLMKDITREGNPVLRNQAKPVKFPLSDEDRELGEKMMKYLEVSQDPELCKKYHLRAGVGLAAPQVGQSKSMAAVLTPPEGEDQKSPFKAIMINPVIISNSVQRGALTEGEGCLSVDRDVPGFVPRADRITVKYQDLEGKEHKIRLKHYPAIIAQHEIDHLHGILFYDHINKNDPFSKTEDEVFFD
ncbi:peptide deformylase [Fructilactobacillus fructivorans]|uniref:peptide deformylase n=1 Tax=Fructilactobacillus fructivorans TaxID=1614 RepID=UPI000704E043|nr:peptide deformylase [Fructilactobacillus fructivorans]